MEEAGLVGEVLETRGKEVDARGIVTTEKMEEKSKFVSLRDFCTW